MKAICMIDNKEIKCEIINNSYNDYAKEVKIIEGVHTGRFTIVENEDILFVDEELKTDLHLDKKTAFKTLVMNNDIEVINIDITSYYDEVEKVYLTCYCYDDDGELIEIADSSSLIYHKDSIKLLTKESNKLKNKLNKWLNNNIEIKLNIVEV